MTLLLSRGGVRSAPLPGKDVLVLTLPAPIAETCHYLRQKAESETDDDGDQEQGRPRRKETQPTSEVEMTGHYV